MAALSSFGIAIMLQPSPPYTNPVNAPGYIAVAPWGQSATRSTVREAVEDLIYRAGGQQGGVMGAYMNSQTLNGATSSSPPTPYTSANQVGIP
jgi:hypothetical protein